jgi:hypothetical protein
VAERAVLGLVGRYSLLTLGAPTGCNMATRARRTRPATNGYYLLTHILGRSDMHHGDPGEADRLATNSSMSNANGYHPGAW